MKKIYIVEKAKNGFIIRFDHLKCSFETPKLRIAKDLEEVIKILKEDVGKIDEEEISQREKCTNCGKKKEGELADMCEKCLEEE